MYQEKGTINLNDSSAFQFDEDSVAYERSMGLSNAMLCSVEFTEGDKRTIRAMARVRNIEAINDYLQRVTEQSGRMMQRISGKPASEVSKQAYNELQAEFPYQPYETDDKYVTYKKELQVSVVIKPQEGTPQEWMYQIRKYEE
ncbi:hypothetical protein GCM10011513_36960 [Franconibacter daqui]|uniref:hypothetical protein n=1 Tax=Franconibacter daqui TaxID=2047724 RepID=UPI0016695EB4|nr:hypothetical protein [Franconibacter daqui]GGD35769.1 hypothetical protein GCM10011513_36960 [Franconibacter daqui]